MVVPPPYHTITTRSSLEAHNKLLFASAREVQVTYIYKMCPLMFGWKDRPSPPSSSRRTHLSIDVWVVLFCGLSKRDGRWLSLPFGFLAFDPFFQHDFSSSPGIARAFQSDAEYGVSTRTTSREPIPKYHTEDRSRRKAPPLRSHSFPGTT